MPSALELEELRREQDRQKISLLRAARLAHEAANPRRPKKSKRMDIMSGDLQKFKSLIDTSGACHIWKGSASNNHEDAKDNPNRKTYDRGVFNLNGRGNRLAHRLICEVTFNVTLTPDLDVSPMVCGNHLCCNVDHLGIVPHNQNRKLAVPVAVYFSQPNEDGRIKRMLRR